jgi:phosphatidylinositol alpha-1,6-mannosyltransferase
MWIGLFSELSGVGGIQQVSRHMGAVLMKKGLERNTPCQLLGLNDARGSGSFRVGSEEYSFRGFARDKRGLASFLLRAAPELDTLFLGHVNLAPLGLLVRLVRPRINYWVVAHGVEVWESLPVHRRLGLRHAQRVLSVSAYTTSQMVEVQKLDPRRVFLLPPALDPAFIVTSCDEDPVRLPSHGRVLLTVGRLISSEPGKGIDLVIRVFSDVLKAVPDLFYVIIGGGDLQPRLEELAQESSARGRILFTGRLNLEQLKQYYSRSDIFVMPSRQEGFGIVFLEAMALGKPVIAGDHGGAPEVVQNGVTGFLVNLDDPDALTNRLILLLRDEVLSRKMGDAGRRRVEENYTFSMFQERLNHILDNATQA